MKYPANVLRVLTLALFACAIVEVSLRSALAEESVAIQPGRLPVPSATDQAASEKLVREVFATDLAKRTPTERAMTAQKLFQQAGQSQSEPVARFVLLTDAREIALAAGDVTTAWQAIDALAAGYQVDRDAMQGAALAALLKAQTAPQAAGQAADYAIKLVDRLCDADDYGAAQQVMAQAEILATRSRDATRQASTRARGAEVRALASEHERMMTATETLKNKPDDPDANLTLGSYLCFVKGDWAAGLPRLARGPDPDLTDAAMADAAAPATAAKWKAVGDKWWDAAEKKKGIARQALRRRAADWYYKCLPSLTGLSLELVRKRIAESGEPATTGVRIVNLISLIDTSRDSVNGSWSVDKEALISHGGGLVRLQIPYQPPEEYDLRIAYVYTDGGEGMMAMLPTSRGQFMTVSNPNSFYFEASQGSFGKINHTPIKRGEPAILVVKVRDNKIQAYLNDKLISELSPRRVDLDCKAPGECGMIDPWD